ncbi:hypothetical protein DNO38_22010, partial [Escherichia coli]|nr:hypothetical protein [Escherichia coli]NVE53649.1 hypothetical protein [Escherichia coli]NVF24022.1 hypothetical protein [Escherichia coli]
MPRFFARHAATLFFPMALILYDFAAYLSTDLIQPGIINVVRDFNADVSLAPAAVSLYLAGGMNRPDFPGECFICELRLPDHCFRWKHNKLFLLLPEEYGPAFPA